MLGSANVSPFHQSTELFHKRVVWHSGVAEKVSYLTFRSHMSAPKRTSPSSYSSHGMGVRARSFSTTELCLLPIANGRYGFFYREILLSRYDWSH